MTPDPGSHHPGPPQGDPRGRPESFSDPSRSAPSAAYAGLPPRIVLEQAGGRFGRWGKFLLLILGISLMANVAQRSAYTNYFAKKPNLQEKFHSGAEDGSNKVAVLRVEGAILNPEGFIKRQIEQVKADESVKAVVLRIDSPGGTVTASDYLLHHLREMKKERDIPVVVSMGSLCASGGYYLAMAAGEEPDVLFAEPTTWTGSIGVIIPHFDASELLEKWNIKDDSVASHKNKQLGSPTRKLSPEERAEERKILQALVDDSFAGFKEVVRSGRPAFRDDDEALDRVATGEVFTARRAEELGLVDRIGFIEDAIDRAIEMGNLSKQKVRVVRYTRHVPGVLEALSGTEARGFQVQGIDLARLLDLTAPRAYYLSTWLPAVLTNSRR